MTLAIDTADGRDLLLRLAAQADAVLESFRPGQLEEYGLGYDVLAAARPSLVLTRVSPFGQEGPYAQFAASDLILAAIILAGLPGTAAWALGLLVGINMLFGGSALIAMALRARENDPRSAAQTG